MTDSVTIALDSMGGDNGPESVIPAALSYLKNNPEDQLILCGNQDIIQKYLPAEMPARLSIRHTSQEVLMDELPSKALRNKKDSSMRVAIDLVKEGVADACVSAGNTGALMATALPAVLDNWLGIFLSLILTPGA